jgi:hypothetical protein
VGHERNILTGASQLFHHQPTDVLGVHDELIRTAPDKHFNPKRRFLGKLISGVGPEIMDGANQGIAIPQRQSQIEPRMKTLVVDHVWCEGVYFPKDFPNTLKLAKRLA